MAHLYVLAINHSGNPQTLPYEPRNLSNLSLCFEYAANDLRCGRDRENQKIKYLIQRARENLKKETVAVAFTRWNIAIAIIFFLSYISSRILSGFLYILKLPSWSSWWLNITIELVHFSSLLSFIIILCVFLTDLKKDDRASIVYSVKPNSAVAILPDPQSCGAGNRMSDDNLTDFGGFVGQAFNAYDS